MTTQRPSPPDTFTPAESGTDEGDWQALLAARPPARLDLADYDALVVVAAHPDDEALGCGGLIHHARTLGIPVTVVLATWGEASHPESPTVSPSQLAELRTSEMRNALAIMNQGLPHDPESANSSSTLETLSSTIHLIALGLPDGEVSQYHDQLSAAIVDAIDAQGIRRTLVAAPWRYDGHPDHDAAGRAAAAAAARTDGVLAEFPIWFWHWGDPESLPLVGTAALALTDEDMRTKARAILAHESQVRPLSDSPDDAPILPAHVLRHFHRPIEVFFLDRAPADHTAFDALHRTDPDPWKVESRYEIDKRHATIGMLDDIERVGRALEIGCSIGALTSDLAQVCVRVDAIEPSPAAAERARSRTSQCNNVSVTLRSAPHDLPDDIYDLVVLSEVGYFLSPADLRATLDAIAERLEPHGHLLACHWVHPIDGWVLDGHAVHEAIDAHRSFTSARSTGTSDYVLGLWEVT